MCIIMIKNMVVKLVVSAMSNGNYAVIISIDMFV